MSVVLTEIRGGLGNQLFQFAAGYALAQRLGVGLVLDLSWYDNGKANRSFELDGLLLAHETARGKAARKLRAEINGQDGARGKLAHVPGFKKWGQMGLRHQLTESLFAYDRKVEELRAPARLEGNFVSERYFSAVAPEIAKAYRQWLEMKSGMSFRAEHASPVVSIHIRLTDYLQPGLREKFAGSCDASYYRRAIATARRLFGDCAFQVFSDDVEGARKLLGQGEAEAFTYPQHGDAFRDLTAMAGCQHHIIANSTFSWWAAWLNPYAQKTVLAPRHWFSRVYCQRKGCSDVIPPDWLMIENDRYGG